MGAINSIINYFKASYRELAKVSWPSRNEVIWLTALVVAVVIIFAAFLALIDFGLTNLINYLLSLKG
jgi:preprotein translocase subunit SecE